MKRTLATMLISTLLAACGGGGGGGGSDPAPSQIESPAPGSGSETPTNAAPVAAAGADQSVLVGAVVTLDGTDSSDPDGNSLTYAWAILARPLDSAATLSNSAVAKPTFTPDVAGEYVVTLTVNDGLLDSAAATVTVIATALGAASFDDAPELSPAPEGWSSSGDALCTDYRIPATVISSKLVVPAGARCVLENGVTVKGQIAVGAGAEFYVTGAVLEGSVSGEGASLVVIEDSTLGGQIVLLSGQQVALRRNLIDGKVESSSNTGLVTLTGNLLPTGTVQLMNNTGGVTVDVNEIGNTLDCQGNDPEPTGSGNVVGIAKLGQCELL